MATEIVNANRVAGSDEWLDAHLKTIRESIYKEAHMLAKADRRDDVQPRDVAQAAFQFAPGKQFPDKIIRFPIRRSIGIVRVPLFAKMGITGVTLVSAILAIAFGLIGVYQTRAGNLENATGAFDIAKIFAGAIVGSTGANVAATVAHRSSVER